MKTPFKLSLTALALVQGLGLSVAHAQEDTKQSVRADMISLIHRFVNDGDWTVLSRECTLQASLQRLLTAVSSNTYDEARYARKMGYDIQSYTDAAEWRKYMRRSYLLGIIARQKTSHHIPMEHILAGMVATRCGMHKKLWSLFGSLRVLPAQIFINELIDHLMSKPFHMPKRGRIGLAAYDNCGYTRKFQYERVGEHANTRINTANSVDIPIGPECEGIHKDTIVWKTTRHDLLYIFAPDYYVTRMHLEDICKRAWRSMGVDQQERVLMWDYPRDVPRGAGMTCIVACAIVFTYIVHM